MIPHDFPEANLTIGCSPTASDYGADSDAEVVPVRAFRADGQVTELWRATWRERLSVLIFGRVWVTLLTGGGGPQPITLEGRRTIFTRQQRTEERAAL